MDKKELERCRAHLLDREYMSGVERDEARIKATAEVFTPMGMVDEMLDKIEEHSKSNEENPFKNPAKRLIDPACGDGQFLAGALYRRLRYGIEWGRAMATIYGVELMIDNVLECRKRLLCGFDNDANNELLRVNIQCQNALMYHYLFRPEDEQPTEWPAHWRKLDVDERQKEYLEGPEQRSLF